MSELTELQAHLTLLKDQVEAKNQIERLRANQDFKDIIMQGFCHDEMERQLGLAVCDKLTPETRELCNQLAKASAALNNYLNTVVAFGNEAEEDLEPVSNRILEIEVSGEEE